MMAHPFMTESPKMAMVLEWELFWFTILDIIIFQIDFKLKIYEQSGKRFKNILTGA